jgi:glycerol-3-phosphate acyltransferase PlsY
LNLFSHLGLPGPGDLGTLAAPILLAAVAGYFFGALPFGYLVARGHGINIFERGSRSPGATNVRRVVGARAGYAVFALDALKGALAAAWPIFTGQAGHALASSQVPLDPDPAKFLGVIGLVAALLGHSFSCFTRFRGGKGVATAAGGFLLLMPLATLAAAAVWGALFFAFRYVSLASIVSVTAMPFAAYFMGEAPFLVLIASFVAFFVILRHRSNLGRLLKGTEHRFGARRPESP